MGRKILPESRWLRVALLISLAGNVALLVSNEDSREVATEMRSVTTVLDSMHDEFVVTVDPEAREDGDLALPIDWVEVAADDIPLSIGGVFNPGWGEEYSRTFSIDGQLVKVQHANLRDEIVDDFLLSADEESLVENFTSEAVEQIYSLESLNSDRIAEDNAAHQIGRELRENMIVTLGERRGEGLFALAGTWFSQYNLIEHKRFKYRGAKSRKGIGGVTSSFISREYPVEKSGFRPDEGLIHRARFMQ